MAGTPYRTCNQDQNRNRGMSPEMEMALGMVVSVVIIYAAVRLSEVAEAAFRRWLEQSVPAEQPPEKLVYKVVDETGLTAYQGFGKFSSKKFQRYKYAAIVPFEDAYDIWVLEDISSWKNLEEFYQIEYNHRPRIILTTITTLPSTSRKKQLS